MKYEILLQRNIKSFLHKILALHKKSGFPLRTFSVNVTKSAVSCRFGLIY